MPRRREPTTMRTVLAHEIGAPPPLSGKQMNIAVKERAAGQKLRALVEKNPDLGHRIYKMIAEGTPAVDILAEHEQKS